MANDPRYLLHLFDRPCEPVFMPKGDTNEIFDVPPEYFTDQYRPIQNSLTDRFGEGNKVRLNRISLPDISDVQQQLGRRDSFSVFLPKHRELANRLVEIFMGMRNVGDFLSAATYCRDRVNPLLFNYALSVAILHRPDTKNLQIPSACEIFPEKFIDGGIFNRAREDATLVPRAQRLSIEIPRDYTATDRDPEHRVAYFREDVGINLHHWHWHLVYPMTGSREIIGKDRRGELFYYMHQQIMARYNFERLCNNLGLAMKFNKLREPIAEGYFPKLDSLVAGRQFPPRFENVTLQDVNRQSQQIQFDILDMETWSSRIYDAIHKGTVVDGNLRPVQLSESQGIDILGNIIEASDLSINKNVYGDYHNFGHLAISTSHDPDERHLEPFGVMGDTATAMRDPIFYRWHGHINDIFQEHKSTLPRYTTQQLDFPGVRVTGVEVTSQGSGKNQLNTFWEQNEIDISRGLDFTPRGSLLVKITHLQHRPFTYNINVENSGKNKLGTVRIFIAPKNNQADLPMMIRDQRHLFVELDKFIVNIKPGKNTFTRDSKQSSVTIPFERTFRPLGNRENLPTEQQNQSDFCGCGWPQHMLIAKGTQSGFPCVLFVMVTDFEGDKVEGNTPRQCSDAASYCGIKDQRYPDKRPMGFPFDRPPRSGVSDLRSFMTPNMRSIDVRITHSNTVTDRS